MRFEWTSPYTFPSFWQILKMPRFLANVIDSPGQFRVRSKAGDPMSRTHCRGGIAIAAILVALITARSAEAQHTCPPGAPCGNFCDNTWTGVRYDLMNQAHAAKHLRHAESKLRRDAGQQNSAAVDHDLYRIANLDHRMRVNDWLIRYNSCQELIPYPHRVCLDPFTSAAISNASRPPGVPPISVPWNGR
jgi:hypothetical protein